jgi:hypothetical protein
LNPLELSFAPVDNQRLANLCGALDENLKQIESAFDVSIARRGEHFSISGAPDPARLAAEALQRFYQLASRNVSLEEIQLGLIEISGAAARASDDDALVLQTRRRDLHGRTPRQVQYIRQIRATTSVSASARRAPARPFSPSPAPSMRSNAVRCSASCSRGRRSRPASASASCPATWRRRSIPTCGRSTTPSTT